MAEEKKDWYAILGVERTATSKEIQKAYRAKALKFHPDKNPDPNAAKIFHELTQANDLLQDSAARAAFDNLLNVRVQAQERANKYDSTRKKMKEDLESRENAFKKQQQEEKMAESRMAYERERLKKETARKMEERKAELLRQADQELNAAVEAKLATVDGATALDTTLKLTWKKKKHTFDTGMLTDRFKKYGEIDSCLSKNAGSALISFKTQTGASQDEELQEFNITWAGGKEPSSISNMRARDDTSSQSRTATSSSIPKSTPVMKAFASAPVSAFNIGAKFTPAFSIPGREKGFGGISAQVPSFSPPSALGNNRTSILDNEEAATFAQIKKINKDSERKRLAEEMIRQDLEEEERDQSLQTEKKQRPSEYSMQSIKSHIQEGARYAAGQLQTPLTNAISEQRRLIENLANVSRVRVEECKHMMTWSKYQTEDLGDVLLKLNLLVRKISDYELRFGTQYEQFREQIKFLRTKDDAWCEAGRAQLDLMEASKTRFRYATKKLLQKEAEDIQQENDYGPPQLQQLKRKVIKEAYTNQLDSIIELGRKMQIIGEHGKRLLDHIDIDCSGSPYNEGHATENILQAARIALENWDQIVVINANSVLVHPPLSADAQLKSFAGVTINSAEESMSRRSSASVSPSLAAPPLPPRAPTPSSEQEYSDNESLSDERRLQLLEEEQIERAIQDSLREASAKNKNAGDVDNQGNANSKATGVTPRKSEDIPINESEGNGFPGKNTYSPPRNGRGPQAIGSGDRSKSWVSANKLSNDNASNRIEEDLGDSPSIPETMGEDLDDPPLNRKSRQSNQNARNTTGDLPLESMGLDGNEYEANYMPQGLTWDGKGDKLHPKINTGPLLKIKQQELSPCVPSPELQYLQVQDSPQISHSSLLQQSSNSHYSNTALSTSIAPAPPVSNNSFQPTTSSYRPTTTYVPQTARQKNRLSSSGNSESNLLSQLANQKAYQLAHQQSFQQSDKAQNTKNLQPQQQRSLRQQQFFQQQNQKRLQDFYYTPNEQEQRNQEDQSQALNSTPHQTAGNWSYPTNHNSDSDTRYKEEHYGDSSYSSGPIAYSSNVPDNSVSSYEHSYRNRH
ncbi:DnaJ (Hsp40), sub C, member 17 [Entomortierella beljakovae]|nr:DnaJ (Hsp40), sub C, member 17 [Entomortierella beljakovae]